MILKRLTLSNFKNHQNRTFEFSDRINCVVGKNGVGKTNLLDAVHYLAFTKSSIHTMDKQAVMHEMPFFTVFGEFDRSTIAIQYEIGKTKQIKVNQSLVARASHHVGRVPLVIILPEDTWMIKHGSEERRKFMDSALCQLSPAYLESLVKYNKLLKLRNAALKIQPVNFTLLETYDEQLVPLGIAIARERAALIASFKPFFEENYHDLHQGGERPDLSYETRVDESFAQRLKGAREKDVILQRTTVGTHKDDLIFSLDGELIKQFGSQGQQKTFIVALKLALFDFIKEEKKMAPLLLLDDIFDKLDDSRIELLIKKLDDKDRFGQVFISDARIERSTQLLKQIAETNIIEL